MPTLPKAVVDAGGIAVVVFLIACIVYTILKIIQTVKAKVTVVNGNGQRVPGRCIQSPELQAIRTNQALTLEAVRKIEEGGDEIKQNMVLQTKLMEQFGAILSKLSDCMVRQEATDKARDDTRAWPPLRESR